MAPRSSYPNRSRLLVNQNRRITNPVIAPFRVVTHIHDDLHLIPRLTTISRSRHPHVNVPGQISPRPTADIVNPNQSSRCRGRKSWDPVGVHTIITTRPQSNT